MMPRHSLHSLTSCLPMGLASLLLCTAMPGAAAMPPGPDAAIVAFAMRGGLVAAASGLSRQASPTAARRSPSPSPGDEVGAANASARVEPAQAGFENAIQRYAWSEGALFQVYAKPGQVTDIVLEEGERLVGPGPVAAGDTVRWMIGDTLSGAGSAQRVHILVKPTRPDISTNLVINTDRRTYHLELRANARVYMASVSWSYPEDELIALRQAQAEAQREAPVAAGLRVEDLNFNYRISGDKPAWRPVRVFDDGKRTLVEFPPDIAQDELPPFFVLSESGEAELVNYRVTGRYLITDRLFSRAEFRIGTGRRQQRVTITNRQGPGS